MRGRTDEVGKRYDKTPVGAHRRHPMIGPHAAGFGQTPIVAVEFNERLRMLGNKSDRRDDNRNAVATGTPQLLFDRWPKPGERPDPALIAHPPIRRRVRQRCPATLCRSRTKRVIPGRNSASDVVTQSLWPHSASAHHRISSREAQPTAQSPAS